MPHIHLRKDTVALLQNIRMPFILCGLDNDERYINANSRLQDAIDALAGRNGSNPEAKDVIINSTQRAIVSSIILGLQAVDIGKDPFREEAIQIPNRDAVAELVARKYQRYLQGVQDRAAGYSLQPEHEKLMVLEDLQKAAGIDMYAMPPRL